MEPRSPQLCMRSPCHQSCQPRRFTHTTSKCEPLSMFPITFFAAPGPLLLFREKPESLRDRGSRRKSGKSRGRGIQQPPGPAPAGSLQQSRFGRSGPRGHGRNPRGGGGPCTYRTLTSGSPSLSKPTSTTRGRWVGSTRRRPTPAPSAGSPSRIPAAGCQFRLSV